MARQEFTTDVVIIGGGVIGTAVARELSKYQVDFILVEKEAEVGWGTTKANSGIVHAGFHDKPGSQKAKYCVEGNRLYPELCEELDVSFRQNGVMMVAQNEDELPILQDFLERGKANRVPGVEIITGDEARKLEPNLSEDVIAALVAPTGGIVVPFELAAALMENALQNGGKLLTDNPVENIKIDGPNKIIQTSKATITAKYVINAAGLYGDKIANMVGDDYFSIHPRKGEEYLLDKQCGDLVNHTIFPTPTKNSKGILVIPTSEGNLMIGPTGDDIEDKEDITTTQDGFSRILSGVKHLVPKVSPGKIIAQFAGVRAACNRGDFIVEPSPNVAGFIHLAGLESPGLTAAPAIAKATIGFLKEAGLATSDKPNFQGKRRPLVRFHALSRTEQDELVQENPSYGRVICRCETVTEGEIVDAIKRGARTIDGVKFRVRAGMGRCQGGFCQPLVMQILSRELGIPLTEVTKRGGHSRQVLYRAKEFYTGGDVS